MGQHTFLLGLNNYVQCKQSVCLSDSVAFSLPLPLTGERAGSEADRGGEGVHFRRADAGKADAERVDPAAAGEVRADRPPGARHARPLPPHLQRDDFGLGGRHRQGTFTIQPCSNKEIV